MQKSFLCEISSTCQVQTVSAKILCDFGRTWQWDASKTCAVCKLMFKMCRWILNFMFSVIELIIVCVEMSVWYLVMFTARCQVAFYLNIDCGVSFAKGELRRPNFGRLNHTYLRPFSRLQFRLIPAFRNNLVQIADLAWILYQNV